MEQDPSHSIENLTENNEIDEKTQDITDSTSVDDKPEKTIIDINNNGIDDKIPKQGEIEFLYLELDTPLPPVAGLSSPRRPDQSPDPPPCPNLKKYASPFLWSTAHKTVTTVICCAVTMMASYAAGMYTPPSQELMDKWHVGRAVYNLGITFYTLGFGTAPMVLAPFSEFNGRKPIFVLSGVLFTGESILVHVLLLLLIPFTVCLIGCGATKSLAGLLIARFFLGIGGCKYNCKQLL